ncbi:shikimate dehydrogenase [Halalkalibacillus halophilus]|uniref:shikimate dehydrogenase n=1 Tax=Halalkalibacillus halophilus TaxID=392827 RepID=UPI000427E2F6|nr:shikimate dehydrogenase [Halalkalibacillus halophilus]
MYFFGLIGNPVKHSKSPELHQSFLNKLGLTGEYHLFEIMPHEILETIEYMKENNYSGFNVTAPYKSEIIPYLDVLDQAAIEMNAVNTVKLTEGKLIGYNTDGQGYIASLQKEYPEFVDQAREKRVLIIGAGGAARALVYALTQHQWGSLDLANRTQSNADHMAQRFNIDNVLSLDEASKKLNEYDLIIQTTTVGMGERSSEEVINLDSLSSKTIASELIYFPKWTNFLQKAYQKNCRLLFGESMLWHQAAIAFEIWTEEKVY